MKDLLDGMEYLKKLDRLWAEVQDPCFRPYDDNVKIVPSQSERMFPMMSGAVIGVKYEIR